ncbi:MAG: hypothetical protein AAFY55_19135, partial [Bacteroidota bacterium]
GVWNLFAMSGILLMQPSDTIGQVTTTDATWVKIRSGLSAVMFFALAWGAWKRHVLAIWAVGALAIISVAGWVHVPVLVSALPDMPDSMVAIWVIYRASALLVLLAIAAYLIRLYRKDRLA